MLQVVTSMETDIIILRAINKMPKLLQYGGLHALHSQHDFAELCKTTDMSKRDIMCAMRQMHSHIPRAIQKRSKVPPTHRMKCSLDRQHSLATPIWRTMITTSGKAALCKQHVSGTTSSGVDNMGYFDHDNDLDYEWEMAGFNSPNSTTLGCSSSDVSSDSVIVEPSLDDYFPAGMTVLVKLGNTVAPGTIIRRQELEGIVRYNCMMANTNQTYWATADKVSVIHCCVWPSDMDPSTYFIHSNHRFCSRSAFFYRLNRY